MGKTTSRVSPELVKLPNSEAMCMPGAKFMAKNMLQADQVPTDLLLKVTQAIFNANATRP